MFSRSDESWSCPVPLPYGPLLACKEALPVEGEAEGAGCILLAGGQGTRLGFEGPKGLFPLEGKTLFERLLGKVERKDRFIAVMTSPLNREETVAYFERVGRFGLTNLHFFSQGMLPLLDERGEETGKLGPDGNGSFFRAFCEAGLDRLSGVDALQVLAVDNPLGRPFDEALIAFHRRERAEATLACICRKEGEAMGLLVQKGEKLAIREYSEIDPALLNEKRYPYGNSGRWVFSLDFVRRMALVELPFHWAEKRGLWKRERFILDALPLAERARAIAFPRHLTYAPVKRREDILCLQKLDI